MMGQFHRLKINGQLFKNKKQLDVLKVLFIFICLKILYYRYIIWSERWNIKIMFLNASNRVVKAILKYLE